MKKKFAGSLLLLLLCLFSGTAYAEPSTTNEEINTEEIILTEENRYDSVYYQEPEERYPTGASRGRATELSLEEYVVNALKQLQPSIDVSAYNIPVSEASETYFQILNHNPSLFYVKSWIKYSYSPSSGMVVSYMVEYLGTEEEIRLQQQKFHQEVENALAWTDTSMGTVEKALAVHDYLVLECEYDYERYLSNSVPDSSHTAYGALVEKTAVCDGYAKAYSCILDELGIGSTVISSDSMNHAWNLVSIDGNWYHADATWDDPVWDSIGRVSHKYFLLSDTAISAGAQGEKHEGWDSNGNAADSTAYDNAFWSNINSAIINDKGNWYYSKYDETAHNVSLMKKAGNLDAQEEVIYTAEEVWGNSDGYYLNSYMYLDWEPRKDEVYFNTTTSIKKLDGNGSPIEVYQPELPQNNQIYGFTVRGEKLCYALQETPSIQQKQAVTEYILEELRLKIITGISAGGVDAVYDGNVKEIVLKGLQIGDTVSFLLEDGSYGEKQPEMINAGTYQVLYKIEREGHEDFLGSAQIIIQKAKPEYTLPTGLKGNSGTMLSSVTLPRGFVWESASGKLKETGEKTFYVTYTPEDTQNYETVSNLAVQVTVSCPGHQYTKKETEAATTTKKGLLTFTCNLCGYTYTEEIPMLKPDGTEGSEDSKDSDSADSSDGSGESEGSGNSGNTGNNGNPSAPKKVTGLTLSKATTTSLKFSWKPVSGAKYRIVLYKGSKAVSTKYTGNSSYTYKKLSAATLYTAKVTSYVENKGKKVYASSQATLKAATAPAKANLLSVKKKGSTKAKLTWKKVTGADGYEISMRTGKGSYQKIKVVSKGKTTTYTKSGLKKGKNYTFRIRAYKSVGTKKVYGSYSNGKTIKIK